MAGGAKVHDIDTIRSFRAALVKFAENVSVALIDGEGEIVKKMNWLQTEQDLYWKQQIRKWTDEVSRAIDKVREKRIFKDSLGRQQSTVDEEKYLKKCRLKLEECEHKHAATKRYLRELQREHLLYRGGVQRLSTIVSADVPHALAMLDGITSTLDAYVNTGPSLAESTAEVSAATDQTMKRAADEAPLATEEIKAEESTSEQSPEGEK